jgi:rhodanese-related sulfurtransferase
VLRVDISVVVIVGLGVVALAAMFFVRLDAPRFSQAAAIERINGDFYRNKLQAQPHVLVDVRTPGEYRGGHLPGAVNWPLPALREHLSELTPGVPVIVYCASGSRSQSAALFLSGQGIAPVYNLGGIGAWQAQGLPVERG